MAIAEQDLAKIPDITPPMTYDEYLDTPDVRGEKVLSLSFSNLTIPADDIFV